MAKIIKFKIKGMIKDTEYKGLSFGRQIEHRRKFEEFKATAQTNHVGQKRRKSGAALKEFLKLYEVTEYYCEFFDGPDCRDDSYQIWYKTKEPTAV